ncbi:MAG TPA: Na+/H+ antiporter NhaA [Methylophilaceae bacterium]|jgi:NhaA family Na+:H+ antiporter
MKLFVDKLSETFNQFFESEKSGGILLILCTIVSLALANSSLGGPYLAMWHMHIGGLSLEHWVNDGLMAIFFLMIGLELERELFNGELADFKKALLPILAALGGMIFPALIHYALNVGLPTQAGIGIPMATDIAFALGILAILGDRVPVSLKVFVAAFAVIDDLGAAMVIALFYTAKISMLHLLGAIGVFLVLFALNRLRVMSLIPYLIGGVIMWVLMLKSGVHATLAGIALAFAIPFTAKQEDAASPSHRLERFLHRPVAYLILPIFALANTGVIVGGDFVHTILSDVNALGIMTGLVLGKPIGISLFCFTAIALGVCKLPDDVKWSHVVGAGMLGGIGFTMSIFITNLAFVANLPEINASKMAILIASLLAGILGFVWLRFIASASVKS